GCLEGAVLQRDRDFPTLAGVAHECHEPGRYRGITRRRSHKGARLAFELLDHRVDFVAIEADETLEEAAGQIGMPRAWSIPRHYPPPQSQRCAPRVRVARSSR